MKFKIFLEGVNTPLISIKNIQKDIKKYQKYQDKVVKTTEITKMLTKIGKKHAKIVGLEFNLETEKVDDLFGEFVISGAFDEDTLNIYFSYTDDEIYIRPELWNYIYNDFPGFIKHEVLHFQQFLRREDLDLETFRELEGGRTNKKAYIDGNLGHNDEIEAYAMNAADELYQIFGDDTINVIKKDIKKASQSSDAMNDYYKLVRKETVLWKKFINKVLIYTRKIK